MMQPIELTCEYLTEPLGIDVLNPRLGWQFRSSNEQCDSLQSAYQILVADSLIDLNNNIGNLWDSGKIVSERSVQIEYDGSCLKSGQRIFWKVRVWDSKDCSGPWSKVARWEMGLLSPSDWHGKWIARTTEIAAQPAPLFRKEWGCSKKVRRARLYIAGLGYYELSINGRRVGDSFLNPPLTRYDRRVIYTAYDVTSMLDEGCNSIGVMLGTGWYDCHTLAVWNFDQAPWRNSPRMILQLQVEFHDGSTELVASDETWKTSTGPVVFDSIYSGEIYDARLEKNGWMEPGYDEGDWKSAIQVDPPGGRLVSLKMPPIKVTQVLRPRKIVSQSADTFYVDFEQNISGWPMLNVSGACGTKITMECRERLMEVPSSDSVPNDMYVKKKDKAQTFQTDIYVLSGKGNEQYHPRFTYHGFQYVVVTGFPGLPKLDQFQGHVVHSAVKQTGVFECSDPTLNAIWKNTLWSQRSNLHGIPTDCPHREKKGWTGDAHLSAEEAIYNFNMAAFYSKWIDDLADAQRESGDLSCIVPSSGWGYPDMDNFVAGPSFDIAGALIPWYMYLYYDDLRILRRSYPLMQRLIESMLSKANDFILSVGLGDWCFANDQTPAELTSTAYLYTGLQLLAKVAGLTGDRKGVFHYANLAEKVKEAFNRKFFDPRTGLYVGGTQTALSASLFHGLTEEGYRSIVFKNLIRKIEQDDNHLNVGILGAKYVLQVLSDFGRSDLAYTLITQPTYPSWAYWINQGATTLWERWDGKNSRNHIMFGDVSAWFFKTLAGINVDPSQPGFKNILIKPQTPRALDYVFAEYDSLHGKIQSRWLRKKGSLEFQIVIPENCTAEVALPDGTTRKISAGSHSLTIEG